MIKNALHNIKDGRIFINGKFERDTKCSLMTAAGFIINTNNYLKKLKTLKIYSKQNGCELAIRFTTFVIACDDTLQLLHLFPSFSS